MKTDFTQLAQAIEQDTRTYFTEFYNAHSQEEIYAFALYSDDGAMTLCPAVNTMQAITDYQNQETGEQFYEFETAEWQYECVIESYHFDKSHQRLDELLEMVADEDFIDFREAFFETCVQVLENLHNENFFRNIVGKEIFLLFTVSDSNFQDNLLPIVKCLNNNFYTQKYQQWCS